MAKQTIEVNGEDVLVREDTAKSYRGVTWALTTLGIILAIALALFLGGFINTAVNGNLDKSPAEIESQRK